MRINENSALTILSKCGIFLDQKLLAEDLKLHCALTGTLLHILVPEIKPDDHNCGDTKDDQAIDDSRGKCGLKGYILLIAGGWIDASVCRPCVWFTRPVGSCILSYFQRPVLANKWLRNGIDHLWDDRSHGNRDKNDSTKHADPKNCETSPKTSHLLAP